MREDGRTSGERAAAFGAGYYLDRKSGGFGEHRETALMVMAIIVFFRALAWFVFRYPKTTVVLLVSWIAYSGLYHVTHDMPAAQFAKSVHYEDGWPIRSESDGDPTIALRIRNDDPSYTIYAADAVCHVQWHGGAETEDAWDLYVAYGNVGSDAVAIPPGTTKNVSFISPADNFRWWPHAFDPTYDSTMQHPGSRDAVHPGYRKVPRRVVQCFLAAPSKDGKLAWQAAGRTADMGSCVPRNITSVDSTDDMPHRWCQNDYFYDAQPPRAPRSDDVD